MRSNIEELTPGDLDPERFIQEKVREISRTVGDDLAVNALSGGVDSSTVTLLAHKALGHKLRNYFIENGLMRDREPERIISLFEGLGIKVELVRAEERFFNALKGVRDPEEKRGDHSNILQRRFRQDRQREPHKISAAGNQLHGHRGDRCRNQEAAQRSRAAGNQHRRKIRVQGHRAPSTT
jgi:GMP synthase PP-ATPase subunit